MRPWIHIPLFIFLLSLVLAGWVLWRDVPVDRQGVQPVLAAGMESPFPDAAATEPSGVLEGILVDAAGIPQAHADLSTLQNGRMLWTHTDEQGRFRLENLQNGPFKLSVLAEDHLPETLAVPGPASDVRLSLKLEQDLAPTFQALAKSTWRGRIRNPLDPASLQGFEVWLNPTGPANESSSGIPRRSPTDEEGRFEFNGLIHGEYSMHLLPPESEGGMGPDLLVPMGGETRILAHDGSQVTAELVSRAGTLQGTVMTGTGPDATPIPAAMVMVTALTQGQNDGAINKVQPAVQTDKRGQWSLNNLKPGRYRVRVRGGGLAEETMIDLDPSQTQSVDFPE